MFDIRQTGQPIVEGACYHADKVDNILRMSSVNGKQKYAIFGGLMPEDRCVYALHRHLRPFGTNLLRLT